ncbi:unnamed protein product [Cylindrotheca closterium]|uniref:Uncharacterized protein n=1 Tax=Cylindrotheca closterium TaxID=2856 RepID=A0AAD2CEN1_9STRA|nr:unnamed protein product [Cylindrotheca closterium]
MCTKTRRIAKSKPDSCTEKNLDAPRTSALNSFLNDLIREKRAESEGTQFRIMILPDDAHGSEGGLLRRRSSRIGRYNSDPLPSLKKRGGGRRSVLDVSDHTKRLSRWLSVDPASSQSKQILSNCMVRQPMRIPSSRRINAACSM